VTLRPVQGSASTASRPGGPSLWRSHLVVRQWLRLASRRRLGVALRLFLSVLLVQYVAGYGTLAADPWWHMGKSKPTRHHEYTAPTNFVIRFFAISTAYLIVGLVQVYHILLIYE